MKGQPFVLLGLNSDVDREQARQYNSRRGINWRSWWEGRVNGPVATAWQMPGLPYLVLIDHQGIIRHQALPSDELESAIARLVAAVPPDGRGAETLPPNREPSTKRTP